MGLDNVVFEILNGPTLEERRTEKIERKGIGHPDTIADAIGEESEREYSRWSLREFGGVPHHNLDKVTACAGKTEKAFGGGKVLKPSYVLVTGQAVTEKIPVEEIVNNAASEYLQERLPNLKESDFSVDTRIEEGSSDLRDLFNRESSIPLSNDSSYGVGFAPYSNVEELVFEIESLTHELRKKYPALGQDVKIAAARDNDVLDLTVACAFVDKYLSGVDDYFSTKKMLSQKISSLAEEKGYFEEVDVHLNAADDLSSRTIDGIYATVTGTSLEQGDNGQTGRGNDVSGLSKKTGRPETKEAVCGKNSTNHVGKLYNLLAHIGAGLIVEKTDAEEAYVELFSKIGKPIDKPKVWINYKPEKANEREMQEVMEYMLGEGLQKTRDMLLSDGIPPTCRITPEVIDSMGKYL